MQCTVPDRANFQLFHAVCLARLGRDEEFTRQIARFREDSAPRRFTPDGEAPTLRHAALAVLAPADREFLLSLHRALYVAEVFLSLEAAIEGAQFLERWADESPSHVERLAADTARGQLLLLAGRHAEYADLATSHIMPGLAQWWNARDASASRNQAGQAGDQAERAALLLLGRLALDPLFAPPFLADLNEATVESMLRPWQGLRETAASDVVRLYADLFLRAAHERLGNVVERDAAEARLQRNRFRVLLADPPA